MQSLPSFPPFDYEANKANAGPRWKKWLGRLENLFVAMNLKSEERQRALLLHYVGERVYDIYEAEKGDSGETYEATKKVLTTYFEPKTNVQMEIYNFRSYIQKEDQSLDEYVTELRGLARNCNFVNTDSEILSQIIQHCRSTRLRKRALREPDKSLAEILELGRSLELADKHAATMEQEGINRVKPQIHSKSNKKGKAAQAKTSGSDSSAPAIKHSTCADKHQSQNRSRQKICLYCGGEYPHKQTCPAKGKTCNYCKKRDHFKKMCFKLKKKEQQAVQTLSEGAYSFEATAGGYEQNSDSSDDEYSNSIRTTKDEAVSAIKGKLPEVTLKANNIDTHMLIDTGASVNIMDENTYKLIGSPKLQKKQKSNLFPYGGEKTSLCSWSV